MPHYLTNFAFFLSACSCVQSPPKGATVPYRPGGGVVKLNDSASSSASSASPDYSGTSSDSAVAPGATAGGTSCHQQQQQHHQHTAHTIVGGHQINSPLASPSLAQAFLPTSSTPPYSKPGSSSSSCSSSSGNAATFVNQDSYPHLPQPQQPPCPQLTAEEAQFLYPHQQRLMGDSGGQLLQQHFSVASPLTLNPPQPQPPPPPPQATAALNHHSSIHAEPVLYLSADTTAAVHSSSSFYPHAAAQQQSSTSSAPLWSPLSTGGQPTIPVITAVTDQAAVAASVANPNALHPQQLAAAMSNGGSLTHEQYLNMKNGFLCQQQQQQQQPVTPQGYSSFPLSPPPSPYFPCLSPVQIQQTAAAAPQVQINPDQRSFYSSPAMQADVSGIFSGLLFQLPCQSHGSRKSDSFVYQPPTPIHIDRLDPFTNCQIEPTLVDKLCS